MHSGARDDRTIYIDAVCFKKRLPLEVKRQHRTFEFERLNLNVLTP